jgi:hypothetical protein
MMISPHIAEALGWVATAVFVASYFFRQFAVLRGMQMLGSALWIVYGSLIAAKPVIAANALVFAAAGWTLLRARRRPRLPSPRDTLSHPVLEQRS